MFLSEELESARSSTEQEPSHILLWPKTWVLTPGRFPGELDDLRGQRPPLPPTAHQTPARQGTEKTLTRPRHQTNSLCLVRN